MRSLDELLLEGLCLTFPDARVCQEGTEAIMKFLCKGRTDGRGRRSLPKTHFRSAAAAAIGFR